MKALANTQDTLQQTCHPKALWKLTQASTLTKYCRNTPSTLEKHTKGRGWITETIQEGLLILPTSSPLATMWPHWFRAPHAFLLKHWGASNDCFLPIQEGNSTISRTTFRNNSSSENENDNIVSLTFQYGIKMIILQVNNPTSRDLHTQNLKTRFHMRKTIALITTLIVVFFIFLFFASGLFLYPQKYWWWGRMIRLSGGALSLQSTYTWVLGTIYHGRIQNISYGHGFLKFQWQINIFLPL